MPSQKAGRRAFVGTTTLCFALTGGCVQVPESKPKPVVALVTLLDLSRSASSAPEARCGEAVARARETLKDSSVHRLDALVLGTGDATTAGEPVILLPWSRWESPQHLYEKPGALEAARNAWLEALGTRCRENARATTSSPIYAALQRAIESSRARCDELDSRRQHCERRLIALHSDLRENGNTAITAALHPPARARKNVRSAPEAIPRLDLAGVELRVCGVSDTRSGSEEPVQPELLLRVWTQVFGPQTPAFDATCPSEAAQ